MPDRLAIIEWAASVSIPAIPPLSSDDEGCLRQLSKDTRSLLVLLSSVCDPVTGCVEYAPDRWATVLGLDSHRTVECVEQLCAFDLAFSNSAGDEGTYAVQLPDGVMGDTPEAGGITRARAAVAPYVHEAVGCEVNFPGGVAEIDFTPGIWAVVHKDCRTNRRLDVWACINKESALETAAQIALDGGLDQAPEAVERFKNGQFQWVIDRHNEAVPAWGILEVKLITFVSDATLSLVVASTEIRAEIQTTAKPKAFVIISS